jgi:hypothetical protein
VNELLYLILSVLSMDYQIVLRKEVYNINMNRPTTIIVAVFLLALVIYLGVARWHESSPLESGAPKNQGQSQEQSPDTQGATAPSNTPATTSSYEGQLFAPIDQASKRITKKSFGTYVTPRNSPVSPEKFTGFHTGVDFEIFENEINADVPIKAICSGKLLRKTSATGYGGYAVQACTINGQAVTVVYGHLRLASIGPAVNEEVKVGAVLGVLGTGYSSETDGERKHLHLSIHTGNTINIRGYVAGKEELSAWLNPKIMLGL